MRASVQRVRLSEPNVSVRGLSALRADGARAGDARAAVPRDDLGAAGAGTAALATLGVRVARVAMVVTAAAV